MASLTLVDHLRMTFGHVVHRHRAHSQLAHAAGRRNRWLIGAEGLLLAGTAFFAIATAFGQGRPYAIAGAIIACLALIVLLVRLTTDWEDSAKAHSVCAVRLWLMREKYRAFLSDLADGTINLDTARQRRDALITELHDIYASEPPEDRPAYQAAAQAVASVDDAAMADEEIDVFLPKSLQRTGTPWLSRPPSDLRRP